MNSLEKDLRDEFVRRVAVAPSLPQLDDTVVRRGRSARRRRTALVSAAGASFLALALAAYPLMPSRPDRPADVAAAPLTGPPRVPLFVGHGPAAVLDWPDEVQRSRPLSASALPVAKVPAGLLVVVGGTQPMLGLLGPDEDEPRVLVEGLAGQGVAVSGDGQRAAVVITAAHGRRLQEVELPSGRVLRAVDLAPPTFNDSAAVQPAAYSGDAVLVNLGEGDQQRTVLWAADDDQVAGNIEGVLATVGGADADFSRDRGAVGGRAAFTVPDERCGTQVHELRNGDGDPWSLCEESFVGFSPDGAAVLATDAPGRALVVHEADGGDVERTFDVPGGVRASGWESNDTLLYTTTDGPRTVVVRCSVSSGACATAADFPDTDRIPQPVTTTR